MKKLLFLTIVFLPLFAQDFLEGVRAEDLMLERIEVPAVEDTIGISSWSKFFYDNSRCVLSPNGKFSVEFWSDGIWIAEVGSRKRRIIDDRGFLAKWAPDGNLIAFLKQKILVGKFWKGHQLYGEDELWICRPNGENKRKLTTNTHVSEFMWSPTGEYICFVGVDSTNRADEHFYLGLVEITTGNKRIIDMGSPYNVPHFSFSPNGKMVAYCKPLKWELMTEWWVTDAELFIANIDGSGKTQITKTEAVESMVKWLPDGDALIIEQHGKTPFDFSFPRYVKVVLKKK